MRRIALAMALVFSFGTMAMAQDTEEREGPNFDELAAFLNLSDSQLTCLEQNQEALRAAVGPSFEELRDLQRALRQARRNGEDTTALEGEIAAAREAISSTRSSFVVSAQACLTADQADELNELIAAETLMNEVRQAQRITLIEGTEENAVEGVRRRSNNRRGRGQGGPGGPGGDAN